MTSSHRHRSDAAAGPRACAAGPAQGPADARRDPRRGARPGLAHGAGGPVDRRAGRGHADEQVGRLRPLRLARGTADLGHPRVPRPLRGRGVLPRHRASRAACRGCARCSSAGCAASRWKLDSGCIYISGAVEFDDRPGPVRDALAAMVRAWHAALERAIRLAVDDGHLRADTDPTQMLFEMHGLILALHHDARFLRTPGALDRARAGFERVLSHYARRRPRRARPRRRARRSAPPEPLSPFTRLSRSSTMAQYTPPLRDMQFVLHELLHVTDELQAAAARTPRSTPTPSTPCSRRAASSPPRCCSRSTSAATPKAARWTRPRTRCARPRASRRPTPSTSKAAGRR